MKEGTDEYLAKNLWRMTREAEQRETRLRDDMEKLRNKQDQTHGTLDARLYAMMERRTQAIIGLLGDRSGLRNRGANSGAPTGSRE